MENLVLDESKLKVVRTNTYRVSKMLFRFVLLLFTVVFIALLVLTIYFGVNQKIRNDIDDKISTTAARQMVTTAVISAPPVKRIPENLQQQLYELTISPNFTNEKFSGKENFKDRIRPVH